MDFINYVLHGQKATSTAQVPDNQLYNLVPRCFVRGFLFEVGSSKTPGGGPRYNTWGIMEVIPKCKSNVALPQPLPRCRSALAGHILPVYKTKKKM